MCEGSVKGGWVGLFYKGCKDDDYYYYYYCAKSGSGRGWEQILSEQCMEGDRGMTRAGRGQKRRLGV